VRNKIEILDKKGQEGMRKVCRLAREVLDIAAAAAKPGVTTDYIDEVVHKACLEREVSSHGLSHSSALTVPVLPVAPQLCPLPEISLHIPQRSYLPRDPGSKGIGRRGYSQH
jgi:hypothetical protein